MRLKTADELTWNDLPHIESPFFALTNIQPTRSSCMQELRSIYSKVNRHADIAQRSDEQILHDIKNMIERGTLFSVTLLCEKPLQPMVHWVDDSETPGQGHWEPSNNIYSNNFMLNHAIDNAIFESSSICSPNFASPIPQAEFDNDNRAIGHTSLTPAVANNPAEANTAEKVDNITIQINYPIAVDTNFTFVLSDCSGRYYEDKDINDDMISGNNQLDFEFENVPVTGKYTLTVKSNDSEDVLFETIPFDDLPNSNLLERA